MSPLLILYYILRPLPHVHVCVCVHTGKTKIAEGHAQMMSVM